VVGTGFRLLSWLVVRYVVDFLLPSCFQFLPFSSLSEPRLIIYLRLAMVTAFTVTLSMAGTKTPLSICLKLRGKPSCVLMARTEMESSIALVKPRIVILQTERTIIRRASK
jgi:hypothetical protein